MGNKPGGEGGGNENVIYEGGFKPQKEPRELSVAGSTSVSGLSNNNGHGSHNVNSPSSSLSGSALFEHNNQQGLVSALDREREKEKFRQQQTEKQAAEKQIADKYQLTHHHQSHQAELTSNPNPNPNPAVSSLGKPLTHLLPNDEDKKYEQVKFSSSTINIQDFDLLRVVGKGSFGKVMQVRKKDTGKIYAMKVLKKEQLVKRKQVAHTKTERRVLEDIDHPFIVSLRYAFQNDQKLYMVLDYFSGGELFFHLKTAGRFPEPLAKFYAAQITLALECLHKNTIVYRDLKPENVLLDEEGNIRLTDFGLSKEGITSKNLTHTFCGTPEYLAPEVIHGAGYGLAVDWWSLGTLLFEMLTGLPPFFNQNLHVMYEKIIRGKLVFPSYVSQDACAFLAALLDRSPKTRLGSRGDGEEVRKHPFFKDIDWEKMMKKQVEPPFKPTVTDGKMDVGNVDEEFKNETPKDTPVMSCTLKTKVNFPDFTFAGRESLDEEGGHFE